MALGLSCAGPLSDACDERGTCRASSGADAASGDASDAGAERACDPTKGPADEPCVLDNALGVFVASAAGVEGDAAAGEGGAEPASGDGSMSQPYTTIAQALANLGSKARIYVCNGSYGEQVSVTAAVSLYGGLSCAVGSAGRAWSYVGGSAQVTSPSPAYALSVAGAATGSVTIEDVSFAAPNATAAGGSSIAALITSSAVHLQRVTLSAGSGANGAAGANGMQNPNYTASAPAGGSQLSPGPPGSGTFTIAGGIGGLNQCSHFGVSAGGDGGLGCSVAGLGTPGTAAPQAPVTVAGRDGLAGADGGADGGAVAGDPGADGLAGDGGVAAQAYGSVSASGWVPNAGGNGDPGNPGQGGAGATDPLYGSCGTSTQSIGGGGGGAGGCGGAGGKGGGGGGASIALASVTSTIELTACTLSAGAAGTGGAGGAGQDGQAGATGGDATFPAEHAAGGAGGNGAGGSGGAGGAGGISVGILNLGSMITSDKTTTMGTSVGGAGAGGAAGPAGRHSLGGLMTGMDGHSGAPGNAGTSAAVLQLM
jgi:hypothetical protein